MTEEWRPVRGYEGLYEVSASGKVRSTKRGIILKPCFDGRKQYVHVNLWKDGVQKTTNVHRIVAMAFIPNPNGLPEINHIDEDKTNNAASNLEWCDHIYNSRYGSRPAAFQGAKNTMNKFSEDTVRAIRSEYSPNRRGGTITELSRKYGVSVPHVRSIVTGKRWGWLE